MLRSARKFSKVSGTPGPFQSKKWETPRWSDKARKTRNLSHELSHASAQKNGLPAAPSCMASMAECLVAQIARCNRDVRCDSNLTPKALAMPKSFFASDAKTHQLDLKSQENARKTFCENPAMLACDAKNRHVFKIERCEMPAIRTPAACDASTRDAQSLAMWVERCKPLRRSACLQRHILHPQQHIFVSCIPAMRPRGQDPAEGKVSW